MSENYLFTIIIVNENIKIIDGQLMIWCNSRAKTSIEFTYYNKGYGLAKVHILKSKKIQKHGMRMII